MGYPPQVSAPKKVCCGSNEVMNQYARPRNLSARRAGTLIIVLAIVAMVLVLGVGAMIFGMGSGSGSHRGDVFTAQKGDFEITIPSSGEFAALNQIEIKNQLENRAIVTEIVPEGSVVKKGDVLIRLNDDEVSNNLRNMQNAVDIAQNQYNTALADLEIMQKERESEMAKASVTVKLAELALKSWEEGELIAKREELSIALETSEKDHKRLVDRFEASKRLREQDFISEDEFRLDEIQLIRAKASWEQAKRDQEIYEHYTREQDEATKKSDLDQAKGELIRTRVSYDARVASAESKVKTTKSQLDSDQERFAIANRQLAACIITAPQDGLVVYASSLNSGNWRDNENPPQVGTELYRNQTVMVLPDTSRMVAEVKVNEALSGLIKPGQRATLTSDASSKSILTGEVLSIGVLAESGGWRDPNRRDYTVRIRVDGENDGAIKPSMRCKASIFVAHVDDAVYVPVQAVYRTGPVAYVYRPDGAGAAQHKVQVGRSSELYAEIISGLSEGDVVLTREPEQKDITLTLDLPKTDRSNGGMRMAGDDKPAQEGKRGEGRGGRPGGGEGRAKDDMTAGNDDTTETSTEQAAESSDEAGVVHADGEQASGVTPVATTTGTAAEGQ